MQYFGKESVNYFILAYIALGGTIGIKALLTSIVGDRFKDQDKDLLININVKMIGLEI
jgi:hypothetical protein